MILNCDFDFNDAELISTLDEAPWWSVPFGEKLLARIRLKETLNVLDIGSGTGFPLALVAGMLGRKGRLYGLDPWKEANKRTSRKISQYEYSNAAVLTGEAERIPVSDRSIDLLISNNGLNNVASLKDTLEECHRVCRDGAQLVTTINLDGTMREFYDVFQIVLEEHGVVDAKERIALHIGSKRPRLSDFTNALDAAGFKVENVEHFEFKWRYLSGTAMFQNYSIRLAFLPSWKALVPDELLTQVFCEVEKRLNMLAEECREICLTIPYVCIDAVSVG